MKPVLVAALGLLLPSAEAKVIQWDIQKRHDTPQLGRRSDKTIDASLRNEYQSYYANVSIGNPRQELSLVIDTGSSDTWVPYSKADACSDNACTWGSFDPDKSSSFKDIGRNMFDISYVDNSYATGDYFQDDFEIRGGTIKNLTMGLAMDTSIQFGLIGLGYPSIEASTDVGETYVNLPFAMKQDGLINTVAYSIWLNDLDASTGNLLFGGIDTAKFVGDLTRIEVLSDEKIDNFTHFTVAMTSLEATSPSGKDTLTSTGFPISVILDTGSTLSYLPQDLAEQVWEEVGAEYSSEYEGPCVPCSLRNAPGHFSFGFAGSQGPRINVTMDELVIGPIGDTTSFDRRGETICYFGIQNGSSPYVLGDTFLRSAYVVYDLENNEIGLGATDFNSTKSNIVAFESSGASIPSSTAAADQSDSSDSPQPTQTDLTASEGFQADTDNSAVRSLSASGMGIAAASLFILFTLAEN